MKNIYDDQYLALLLRKNQVLISRETFDGAGMGYVDGSGDGVGMGYGDGLGSDFGSSDGSGYGDGCLFLDFFS